jgi:energy-coupling factor transporter ATP-binding protein EcfA2
MKINKRNLFLSVSLYASFYGIAVGMDDFPDERRNPQSGFNFSSPGGSYPQANMMNQPHSFSMGSSSGSGSMYNPHNPQPGFDSFPSGGSYHQASMGSSSSSASSSHAPFSPLESLDPAILDRLMGNIKEAEKGVRQQIAQMGSSLAETTRVIVLGVTGSGKSTLLHALAGKRLIVRKGSGKMEIDVAPGETLPGFAVGHGVASVTTLPVSWYDGRNKVFYWDCPGFMDTRGPEQDIINAFAVDSLFEPPARIKTLLVLQESEITDSRMTNALSRLDKLGKLLTNQRQLQESLSLVVTKGDGEFEPIDMLRDVMQTMGQESLSIHPLIRFFSERPELVFSLPKPPRSADGKEYNPLFKDRERIIRNLQTCAVENPAHSINLDASSIVYVTGMMSRIDNVDELIGKFAGYMQEEYRTKQLEDLKRWDDFINKLSGLKDDEIDRPEKLVLFFENIPSNHQKFKDVIDRISSTRRIFSFLEKVSRENLSGTIKLKGIPEVLRPLLNNIKAELHELIQSKELIELQKQKTLKIEEELKTQKEEADRKEKEQKKQLQELEARAKEETSYHIAFYRQIK